MINFKSDNYNLPSDEVMTKIYGKLFTPKKLGAVLKFEDYLCDSPTVFKKDGKWYMLFVRIAKQTGESGYETHIACSDDLIHWEYMYPLLRRSEEGKWDSSQIGGYAAFQDVIFGGSNGIQSVNGKNYIVYLGGNLNGYETDPLKTGLCYTKDILCPDEIHKFPAPILSPDDADVREGETLTLYKHCMFIDEAMTTGHKYVSAYNAKNSTHHESIFLAISDDGERWERYGDKPVINNEDVQINGDPQIIKIDDLYIMVYFILDKDDKTYNTFAASYDLVHWKNWSGKHLIESEFDWEDKFAHKSWVLKNEGKVYHFYCAVNTNGERFIALATS